MRKDSFSGSFDIAAIAGGNDRIPGKEYCAPAIKMVIIEQGSMICQSGVPTDTDPFEDRF